MVHWVIAFCCAVEPSAFKVPLEQTGLAGAEEDALAAAAEAVVDEDELLPLELEQAVNTIALAARPAIRPMV